VLSGGAAVGDGFAVFAEEGHAPPGAGVGRGTGAVPRIATFRSGRRC
jgi:hypothetical protein